MSEATSYDNLIAGTQKNLVTRPATVRTGESFSRGSLVGRLTSTGKWQIDTFANAANYSEFGIATEAVDTLTTGVETLTEIFVEGEFSENAILYPYTDTAATWREKLASVGIYTRKNVSVLGQ